MRRIISLIPLAWLAFGGAAAALDQPLAMKDAFKLSIERTGSSTRFHWQIADGYYLYREALSAEAPNGQKLDLQTNPGKMKDDPGFGTTEVYLHNADAILTDAPDKLSVTFQGCQDGGICYPRKTVPVEGSQIIAATDNGAKIPSMSTFQNFEPAGPAPAALPGSSSATAGSSSMVEELIQRGGTPLLLLSFLGFGILLAFTPCVFPMYPILVAMLGRQGTKLTAGRGLLLSSTYAVSLALAFSLFGVLAAWLGQSFQIALQSPTAIIVMAIMFVALGIASFGIFEVQLPAVLRDRMGRLQQRTGGSVGSAAVLGFSSAFLIGPCVTAPLAGSLLYIAKTGDVMLGAAALFALGMGKGIPLIIMGTSGASLLPRAGAWMSQVRWMFGFFFLGTAIWYADRLVEPSTTLALTSALVLTLGVVFGAFDSLTAEAALSKRLTKAAGLLAVLYGAFLAVGAASGAVSFTQPLTRLALASAANTSEPGVDKQSFAKVTSGQELTKTLADAPSGQSSLVYFTADWCVSCRAIERSVLSDPAVGSKLSGMNLVAVDLTDIADDQRKLMTEKNVIGPPTMLFFDTKHAEVPEARLVGEVTTASILASVAQTEAD